MITDVVVHVHKAMNHHSKWGKAFAAGVRAHGGKARIVEKYNPIDCELAVFWGHHAAKDRIKENQRSRGLHYLVMERGYFVDRFEYTSLGYDGLNGEADFLNVNSPPDRWEPHCHLMKPWVPSGEAVLLIGQVKGDNSCNHVDLDSWYKEIVEDVKGRGLPIKFRPHPQTRAPTSPPTAHMQIGELEACLDMAALVITLSSTVGVDSLLAGRPTVAMDPISMAYGVAARTIQEGLDMTEAPDREQWARDLAYAQWTKEEIASGEAWEHLREGPDGN